VRAANQPTGESAATPSSGRRAIASPASQLWARATPVGGGERPVQIIHHREGAPERWRRQSFLRRLRPSQANVGEEAAARLLLRCAAMVEAAVPLPARQWRRRRRWRGGSALPAATAEAVAGTAVITAVVKAEASRPVAKLFAIFFPRAARLGFVPRGLFFGRKTILVSGSVKQAPYIIS